MFPAMDIGKFSFATSTEGNYLLMNMSCFTVNGHLVRFFILCHLIMSCDIGSSLHSVIPQHLNCHLVAHWLMTCSICRNSIAVNSCCFLVISCVFLLLVIHSRSRTIYHINTSRGQLSSTTSTTLLGSLSFLQFCRRV
uniref:Uncharacterized protein n=1 Tax=Arundo donax TaxID=35708 RepID=A0A0A9E739_ARUDO